MSQKQLIDWVELVIAWLLKIPILPILILFFLAGLGIAIIMIINPNLAIELQRRFYEKINWRIEPLSVSKEIRNTRLMGWFLIILLVAIIYFVFTAGLLLP
jgi:hypothetical protein